MLINPSRSNEVAAHSSVFSSISAKKIALPPKRQMSAPSSSTVTSHPLSTQTCSATGYLDSETFGSQSDF
jgi:hypothetical protein